MYSTATFYNHLSFLYPLINSFLTPQRNELINQVNTCDSGKLLEIGVGDGSYLPLYIGHEIIGIDISEAMLNRAKRFESSTISLMLMDAEDLSFPDAHFDYIVICHALAVAENPDKLLEEAYRVLKPGGKLFILNHFTPDNRLRYIDKAFQPFAKLLRFRSSFCMEDIKGLDLFSLIKEKGLGLGSYFKLLIYTRL